MNAAFVIARIVFGLLFIYAAVTKLPDPAVFAQIVHNYQILPGNLVNLAALVLPYVEIICGLALIFGVLARGAVTILVGLMITFFAAMAYNLYRGLDTACGCFSLNTEETNMVRDLVRDSVFLVLGLIAAWGVFRKPRSDRRRWVPGFPHAPKREE